MATENVVATETSWWRSWRPTSERLLELAEKHMLQGMVMDIVLFGLIKKHPGC